MIMETIRDGSAKFRDKLFKATVFIVIIMRWIKYHSAENNLAYWTVTI